MLVEGYSRMHNNGWNGPGGRPIGLPPEPGSGVRWQIYSEKVWLKTVEPA